jgi:Asp-tRNA(Asn)/Glu-tRNA(Gln) amidotransferase A subunit family amidase
MGRTVAGLPAGLELTADHGADRALLALAAGVERALAEDRI